MPARGWARALQEFMTGTVAFRVSISLYNNTTQVRDAIITINAPSNAAIDDVDDYEITFDLSAFTGSKTWQNGGSTANFNRVAVYMGRNTVSTSGNTNFIGAVNVGSQSLQNGDFFSLDGLKLTVNVNDPDYT